MKRGMPDALGQKRTKPTTVHLGPKLRQAIDLLSKHERRTVSAYVEQVLERDPLVKTALQQIEGIRGN